MTNNVFIGCHGDVAALFRPSTLTTIQNKIPPNADAAALRSCLLYTRKRDIVCTMNDIKITYIVRKSRNTSFVFKDYHVT